MQKRLEMFWIRKILKFNWEYQPYLRTFTVAGLYSQYLLTNRRRQCFINVSMRAFLHRTRILMSGDTHCWGPFAVRLWLNSGSFWIRLISSHFDFWLVIRQWALSVSFTSLWVLKQIKQYSTIAMCYCAWSTASTIYVCDIWATLCKQNIKQLKQPCSYH